MAENVVKLSEHLAVWRGHINVGIVRDGEKALLVELGDGRVLAALKEMGIKAVDTVLLSHHHRDQACGFALLDKSVRIGAPEAEVPNLAKVDAYWADRKSRWGLTDFHPFRHVLAEPIRVDKAYKDGESFAWGPAKITMLATPGHTDGSASYVVEVDGLRVAFVGDAIYDEGQVYDLHSMQKGNKFVCDYHGFMDTRPALLAGLNRVKDAKPSILIPSHGNLMRDPAKAIGLLSERLDRCYDKYVAISALRHYFPKMFEAFDGRPGHMPIRKGKEVPACLRHLDTTWMIVSKDKAAFVIDVCSPNTAKNIQKMVEKGDIRWVEAIWITHYHYDHMEGIPDLVKAYNCPVITDSHVADVVSNPLGWRLTCLSPIQVKVDHPTKDGETWQWREFKMTAYHFPGQTLYHSGLLIEQGDLRMLVVGDSYTMSGIDDYCAHNRNWLGKGVGFDYCLELTRKLKPTHIFNEHVDPAFDFTDDEIAFMRANLAEREKLFGEIVPWDHANYGMDEQWCRCFPYEQKVVVGGAGAVGGASLPRDTSFSVIFTNHSSEPRDASCRAVLPSAWSVAVGGASLPRVPPRAGDGPPTGSVTEWSKATIKPKADGEVKLALRVPPTAKPGRYIIPVDVRYGTWDLPQFTEAIVEVK